MKKLKQTLFLGLSILFLFNACVDLEEAEFSDKTTDTYFNTIDDIESGLVATYSTLIKRYGGTDVFNESKIILGVNGVHTGWYTNDIGRHNYLSGTNSYLEKTYLGSYFGISKANLILQKLDEMNGGDYLIEMTDEERDGFRAEARFIRALFYFNLAQFFGEVPINTVPFDGVFSEDAYLSKSTIDEVYNFIVEDFKFAEEYLNERDFGQPEQLGRATKGAAQGMLARVYMSMAGYPLNKGTSHYQLVKDQALKVVESGVYDLLFDYTSLFYVALENNNEWLFTIQFGPTEELTGSWGWQQTVDGRWADSGLRRRKNDGVGRLYATEELVNAYDENDPRFIYNIITTAPNGNPERNAHKYRTTKFRHFEDYLDRNRTGMNAPIIRYADILLLLAEAENELNGPDGAYQYINMVKSRARMGSELNSIPPSTEPADISGLTQETFRNEVFWERARELCWEGMDRLDLVRSGNFVDIINEATYVGAEGSVDNVTDEHIFFPIPLTAILNNPNLED